MNTSTALIQPPPTAQQFSYADETCFNRADDSFREDRQPVTFRLFSVGRALGPKFRVEFTADYGVYYGDDDYLLEHLEAQLPRVNWRGTMVFHRWADQSRIQCLDCDTGKLVAQLEVRRYEGKRVRPEAIEAGEYGANVLTMAQVRQLQRERQLVAELLEQGDQVTPE